MTHSVAHMWQSLFYDITKKKGVIFMREELLKGLTKEQIEKLKACKNNEEILKAAKEEGIELTDEQLEAVSGGNCIMGERCPRCNSDQVLIYKWDKWDNGEFKGNWQSKECKSCGYQWEFEQI